MPNGWSAARSETGEGAHSTSDRTHSGRVALRSMAGSADSAMAKTDTHSLLAASRTAPGPSVHDCIAARALIGTASELPIPRRSVAISRPERGQPAQMPGDGGFVPQQVDRMGGGGHEQDVGFSVPDDLIGEVGRHRPARKRCRAHATIPPRIPVVIEGDRDSGPGSPNDWVGSLDPMAAASRRGTGRTGARALRVSCGGDSSSNGATGATSLAALRAV